ncbi:hypothetical protein AeMF1_012854 [Aphanomyces euteiches]|nr:hypothetical protein AeMF1_012854 [Aphanomyces euteiches]KAH9185967.1 hypothetical protein AeNC1_012056 [Aphanomyces euteiches]
MEGVLLVHAATTGNLPLFQRGFQHPEKWLCGIANQVQYHLSTSTVCRVWLDLAAWSGHVNIITFIASQQLIDDPFDDESCLDGAAAHGHVEVVQYLLDRGCQSTSALELAAANGHLHVVNILRTRH